MTQPTNVTVSGSGGTVSTTSPNDDLRPDQHIEAAQRHLANATTTTPYDSTDLQAAQTAALIAIAKLLAQR